MIENNTSVVHFPSVVDMWYITENGYFHEEHPSSTHDFIDDRSVEMRWHSPIGMLAGSQG